MIIREYDLLKLISLARHWSRATGIHTYYFTRENRRIRKLLHIIKIYPNPLG
jgi:hypothetical protein